MTFCEGMQKIYEEEEFNIQPKMQEYHLMTSVSGPAFDHKVNKGNEVGYHLKLPLLIGLLILS